MVSTNHLAEYDSLVATPTNESAMLQINELKETNKALQAKAEELQKNLGECTVTKEDVERARDSTKRLQKIYKERKKIVSILLDPLFLKSYRLTNILVG